MTACEIIAIHDMEWERRSTMTTLDTLLERNQDFAAHQFPKDVPLMPRAMIIGCVDQRVDPAHVLGLGLGEAIVIRNVGGASPQRRSRPWGCWGGSPRLEEALLRASFTSSCFSTPTAGSLALKETLTCWRAALASGKKASWPKRSLILTQWWR